jgi:hypothetical protein
MEDGVLRQPLAGTPGGPPGRAGFLRGVHRGRGWSEFRPLLEYKTGWYGSGLVAAPRLYPCTPMRSACGRVQDEMPWWALRARCRAPLQPVLRRGHPAAALGTWVLAPHAHAAYAGPGAGGGARVSAAGVPYAIHRARARLAQFRLPLQLPVVAPSASGPRRRHRGPGRRGLPRQPLGARLGLPPGRDPRRSASPFRLPHGLGRAGPGLHAPRRPGHPGRPARPRKPAAASPGTSSTGATVPNSRATAGRSRRTPPSRPATTARRCARSMDSCCSA